MQSASSQVRRVLAGDDGEGEVEVGNYVADPLLTQALLLLVLEASADGFEGVEEEHGADGVVEVRFERFAEVFGEIVDELVARRHDRRLGAIMIEMSRQIGERFAGIYGEQIETNECCRNVCAWNVLVCAKSGRKVLLRLLRRSLSARRRAAMRMWARGLRSRTADR